MTRARDGKGMEGEGMGKWGKRMEFRGNLGRRMGRKNGTKGRVKEEEKKEKGREEMEFKGGVASLALGGIDARVWHIVPQVWH